MTILDSDIKLKQSERLRDTDDGGGMMTNNPVVDGVVNNLFPDISRLDRTAGRVNLRKAFMHVDTANTDTLYGSHLMLLKEPADPKVHMTLFSTGSDQDQRSDAKNFVESYVVSGPTSEMRLWDTQSKGQRTLLLFKDPTTPDANVGDVYCLSVEGAGLTPFQQYVRVTSFSKETRTFITQAGNPPITITREIVTMGINVALAQAFVGEDPANIVPISSARVKVRMTQAADAATYYGISTLAAAAASGDKIINVASVYSQIIPNTTDETPVVSQSPTADASCYAAAGAPITLSSVSLLLDPTTHDVSYYTGNPILPGSVALTLEGGALIDVDGAIAYQTGSGPWTGTVDYSLGRIYLQRSSGSGSYSTAITFTPAGVLALAPYTFVSKISQDNRNSSYVYSLSPLPAPGSVRISYRALGKWYVVKDDGQGNLAGVLPNTGSGTINYATGDVILTCAALPDVDTAILLAWGEQLNYQSPISTATIQAPWISASLGAFDPATLSITWNDGSARTATADATGTISGDATGQVYWSGHVNFRPNTVPPPGTIYTLGRTQVVTQTATPTATNTVMNVPLTGSIKPRSVSITGADAVGNPIALTDDGAGNLTAGGDTWATVDYTSGALTIHNDAPHKTGATYRAGNYFGYFESASYPGADPVNPVFTYSLTDLSTQFSGTINIQYRVTTDSSSTPSGTVTQGDLSVNLLSNVRENIIPGSVRFTFLGQTYFDKSGSLYTALNPATGAATLAGTINYATGDCTISSYGTGTAALSVKATATMAARANVGQIFFRTGVAPIASQSFILSATAEDGTALTATADVNGNLDATYIKGTVDSVTGIVDVRFGQTVNQDNGDGNGVVPTWVFKRVVPSTIKFSAVYITYLPLDPSVLGLDPTRLPVDGRVPIYRPGEVVVIHNTKTDSLATPVAGASVTLSRNPISKALVKDSTGKLLAPTLYTVDVTAGTITYADPLDLSAYTGPYSCDHRQEDMRLLSDVQINGLLTVTRGMAFSYDTTTRVSSALLTGDLGARVENTFTQQAWTNVWSDERIGADSVGKYNDVAHPLIVINASAISERWAIVFTSPTAFQIIGEVSGVIGTGSTITDTAPINDFTGQPYFTILASGWGGGWVLNNVLRFNTVAAASPAWIARTTEAGDPVTTSDEGKIELRGDAA